MAASSGVPQALALRILAAWSARRSRRRRGRPASAGRVGKSTPSRSITKLKMSPPRPQPKHFQVSRAGVTAKMGVFSPWNGQRPLKVVPAFLSWTVSPMNSTRSSFCLTVAAAPTDNLVLPLCEFAPGREPDVRTASRRPSVDGDRPPGPAGGHTCGLVKS